MSWVLHISLPAMSREHISTDQRQPASASTLQAVSALDRSPISDSGLPAGSGDNTPGSWSTGGRNHVGPGWPKALFIRAGRR